MSYIVNKNSTNSSFPELTIDAKDVRFVDSDFIFFTNPNRDARGYYLVSAIRRDSVITIDKAKD